MMKGEITGNAGLICAGIGKLAEARHSLGR
jgi:hypothetical protein